MPKAAFFTLGCKVNQYETAALKKQFFEAGFEIVGHDEKADVYVVNSCTVTAAGDRKSKQALSRMRRQNPGAVICLTGCFPQAFPGTAAGIADVDVVTGSKDRGSLLPLVQKRLAGGERVVEIAAHGAVERFGAMSAAGFHSRTRATVKIEDGCDRQCAYCIIPAARGPVRSKPLAGIRAEIDALASLGYAEVVLTGVNLSRYGGDIGLKLADAVKTACGCDMISRVRLGSLEPGLFTKKDADEMAGLKKLCPHFHLSLQSGCGATLKRMRRPYTPEQYAEIAGYIKDSFKNPAVTTDIMVGFPGETEDDFLSSLKFCGGMSFAKAHVFAYSMRPGTEAAGMDCQIPENEKRRRSKIMIAEMNKSHDLFLEKQIGTASSVLFETRVEGDLWEGYSENYTPHLMRSDEDLRGKVIEVTPKSTRGGFCII